MLAIAAFGCGDDPNIAIELEPAGENCPQGGLKFTDGDTVHYSCDTPAITEAPGENCATGGLKITGADGDFYLCEIGSHLEIAHVPAGSDEHSCVGAAMKITIDGTPDEVKYICLASDYVPAPVLKTLDNLLYAYVYAYVDGHPDLILSCMEDEETRKDFQADLDSWLALMPLLRSCMINAFSAAGPPPPSEFMDDYFYCASAYALVLGECHSKAYDAVKDAESPEDRCDEAKYGEVFVPCMNLLNEESEERCNPEVAPEPTASELAWLMTFQRAATFYGCEDLVAF